VIKFRRNQMTVCNDLSAVSNNETGSFINVLGVSGFLECAYGNN